MDSSRWLPGSSRGDDRERGRRRAFAGPARPGGRLALMLWAQFSGADEAAAGCSAPGDSATEDPFVVLILKIKLRAGAWRRVESRDRAGRTNGWWRVLSGENEAGSRAEDDRDQDGTAPGQGFAPIAEVAGTPPRTAVDLVSTAGTESTLKEEISHVQPKFGQGSSREGNGHGKGSI